MKYYSSVKKNHVTCNNMDKTQKNHATENIQMPKKYM